MAGILETAMTGLAAFQRSMDTTSHNIANVNTEGYSRQRVELSTRPEFFTGEGYLGQGVDIANISRSYDQFINQQLNSSTSAYAESDKLSSLASQVDNITADPATGLSPAFSAFFAAVNEVANDPTSTPVRQVLLGRTESLAQQFNNMTSYFEGLRTQMNNQMQATADDINSYAKAIAALNVEITTATSRTSGQQLPNDLLDQRDRLLTKIAEKINVSSVYMKDGSISLFVGKGQSLVIGARAGVMSLKDSSLDSTHKDILIDGQAITQNITGGELSGELKFRDQVLDPAQQQLGLAAAGLAVQFNAIHATGFDLNGDPGGDVFSLGVPSLTVPVYADPNNAGSVTAVYDPLTIDQLTPSDYQFSYDGANFSLKRLSDNTVTTYAGPPPAAIAGPGFNITIGASVAANDSFLIRPTFEAAQKITTLITDTSKIAAAGTTGGSGLPIPGDNTVALNLADLEKKSTLLGGKVTLNNAYGQMVARVGTLTNEANTSRSAQEVLLNQAKQSRENLVGVNLDEEAANLIKFQNAYQAAAKAVSVASTLFDTLIGAVR